MDALLGWKLVLSLPAILVIEAAEQIAAEWARSRLAPASLEELARKELGSPALLLRRAPRRLDRGPGLVRCPTRWAPKAPRPPSSCSKRFWPPALAC
jgi:hypothetical protein